jgi:ProQ/FINO family
MLWPAAFPKEPESIKPLVSGIAPQVAAATGWNKAYASGVLAAWRMRDAHAQAVISCQRYHDLKGEPTETVIDDAARERARQRKR